MDFVCGAHKQLGRLREFDQRHQAVQWEASGGKVSSCDVAVVGTVQEDVLRRLHSAAVARASGVGHGLGTIGKVLTKFSVASEELGCHEVGGKPTWEVSSAREEAFHRWVGTAFL